MKLTWNGARFEFYCKTGQGQIAKASGFHHDFRNRCYWTGLIHVARVLEMYADDRAKAKLNEVAQQIDLSKAISSDAVLRCPEGLAYLPFQGAGIVYGVQRSRVLNADDMGLGKTIQAIGTINNDPIQPKNILVVPPAGLLINWERELLKWLCFNLSGDYASGQRVPNSDIVLCNYEIGYRIHDLLAQRKWDYIIYDEAHYMKNQDSKRTQAFLGHESKKGTYALEARKIMFLTGTPILNRPVELWPILRVADPEGLGANFWLFAKQFCDGESQQAGMREFSGHSNLDTLQDRLRASIMIRRLKKDVLKELPPKRRQIIPLPGEMAKKVVQTELEFYARNNAIIEESIKAEEEAQARGDAASYNAAALSLQGARQSLFTEMAKLRHDTAVLKVPYLIQFLENALEQNDKIVLFAHHQDVINPIYTKFQSVAVKFDGSMGKEAKQLAVDIFQGQKRCKLFIGSITAAGVGITLTEASYVIFAELSWVPAHITQAEDRVHRIGQLESVLIQHIVFDQSLDATMAQKIIEKQEIIDAAVGG